MSSFVFFVPGLPKPSGSKKAFRHAKTSKVIVVDACDGSRDWKTTVSQFALAARAGCRPMDGPLRLVVEFRMPRPKAHYRANGELRDNAPAWHTNAPDATKLLRAVEDALNGVLWRDDRQVVLQSVYKAYGESPGANIMISAVT